MNFFSRIFGWHKSEPAPFVPVYPVLPQFGAGEEVVVSAATAYPVPSARHVASKPAQKIHNRTKPFNKPKAAARISAGVLSEMRSAGFFGAITIAEVDEWVVSYCAARGLDLGALSHRSIRTALKASNGIRYEYRRLLSDPAYSDLRKRHVARKQFMPERAWIFIIDDEPESAGMEAQLEKRAA